MKRTSFISIMILSVIMTGCGESKQATGDFITVDVKKNYPKKELILQDFLDVEYILLDDTKDDFLTTGLIQYIGKEIILVRNRNRDGNILVYDRKGAGLRVINRVGQGSQEYTSLIIVTLDEGNNEIYVKEGLSNRILVYDLFGTFKRSFMLKTYINSFASFDRDHLIYCDASFDSPGFNQGKNRFLIMSKQDGSVVKEIEIPYEKKTSELILGRNGRIVDHGPPPQRNFISHRDHWILTEISSDTIFRLMSDYSLIPFIVRTPSVQSMDPEIFLYPNVLTDRYYFMRTTEKTPTRTETRTSTYPVRDLMYDRQEEALFEYVVYNDDFTNKKPVNLAFEDTFRPFYNKEIALVHKLESFELVEAYGKGELKGKLKELASKLNDDSNPVIMIATYKK